MNAFRIATGVVTMIRYIVSPRRWYKRRHSECNLNGNEKLWKLMFLFEVFFLNYLCSLGIKPNVVQMMSQAFSRTVVASFSFFLSMAANRPKSVSTLMSLLFHSRNSAALSFSSSRSRARIFSSNVFLYWKQKCSGNLWERTDVLQIYLFVQLIQIG